jgi:hypothetical protein
MAVTLKQREDWIAGLPTLEDANSIQVGLAEVMRLLVTQEVDHKTGALLLYAMQTASVNVTRTSFEPEPTMVVIDRKCVEQRPLGASAWSKIEGRDYDDLTEDDLTRAQDNDRNEGSESWRSIVETPENERLLPNESHRDRYIRVQKQRGLEVDPTRL